MPSIIPKITINGKESTEISGLIIVSLPPIIKPAMRAVAEEIDGRDGDQIEKLGFSAYDKTIRIALSGNYDVDDVIEYFNQDGIITFSNEPDKYYRFKQLEGIDFEKLMRYKTADVVIHCQPFKFSTTDEELTFFEPHSVSITNAGNIYSKPEIALTGHGNMEMGINGSPVLAVDFGDEQQTIIIDSEKMNAYGAQSNIKSLITEINPKQDLHGYDSAWTEKGNNSPYLFRKVAGTASRFGNGIYDQIVGGSFAFNQHIDLDGGSWTVAGMNVSTNNGNMIVSGTASTTSTASLVPSSVYNKTKPVFNHKYCLSIKGNHNFESLNFAIYGDTNQYLNSMECIFECNVQNSTDAEIIASFVSGNNYSANLKAYLIDLTQMLGSTIADYIYSLEQASAGAGVSYFKALFPNDYYPYNAGELLSVKALAHNTIGFNQWDEEWEFVNSKVTSKNYISVLPDTVYFFCNTKLYDVEMFDSSKNSLGNPTYTGVAGGFLFTTASNCAFIKFSVANSYGTTYNHDICINFSDASLNGTYKAYSINRYLLDDDLELRGIPQIDANGKLTYDGDKYSSDGSVVRKYGVVDLGSLGWGYLGENGIFIATITNIINTDVERERLSVRCSAYSTPSSIPVSWADVPDKSCLIVYNNNQIAIKDTAYNNTSDFAVHLQNINARLVYLLETATTETANTFTNPQIVDENGSEEYVDGNFFASVDLGSLEWQRIENANGAYFYGGLGSNPQSKANAQCICEKYQSSTAWLILNTNIDDAVGVEENYILIRDTDYTDAISFKNAMSNIYLFYEKASASDVSIPVGHNTLYANICEIEGWNSCDVSRTGVNLWDETWENCYWDEGRSGIKVENAQSFGCADYIFIKGAESLYFKAPNSQTPYTYYVLFYDENKNMISFVRPVGETVLSIPENAVYCTFYNYLGYGTSYNHDISFNLPETETDYFAFEGITKNIPFNQTVFGGSLNVKTGLLTISKVKISGIVQSIAPYSYNNIVYGRILKPENSKNRGNTGIHGLITSMFYVDGASGNWDDASKIGKILTGADYDFYWIGFPIGSTLDDMQNITANNEICYELASPILIQLTAEEIMALIGKNHIFTNTGAIESCVYMKDGAEIETSGEIITFIADVGDIISNAFKNRLVIGNYDDVKLEKGINIITFNPIEEGSEIDEMAISKYSRWL